MEGCDYFAIFDGHSGAEVARLSKNLLHERIKTAIQALGPDAFNRTQDIVDILKRAFIEHNQYLASVIDTLHDSGSTATVALVTPTQIFLAYLGDSPCFLMNPRTGVINHTMGKHEPSLATETARIERAGGFVEIDEAGVPRVDGLLAVSRAFGDFSMNWKGRQPPAGADWTQMKVTAHPDVVVWKRPELGLLAIMSDGLVETNSSTLKPVEQVARDIQKALDVTSFNLKGAADHVLQGHMKESGMPYDGDDLSMILIDVGGGAVALAEGGGPRPMTRKGKKRRSKTGKKNRIIKIFSC
jgi:serine/threonine protein phosphatase PrpC